MPTVTHCRLIVVLLVSSTAALACGDSEGGVTPGEVVLALVDGAAFENGERREGLLPLATSPVTLLPFDDDVDVEPDAAFL